MVLTATTQGIELTAKLFRGLSDGSRLAILHALRDGPLTVSEIVLATGLRQANTSNHLGCLRDCGLVAAEAQGRFTRYRFADPRVGQLLAVAGALVADVAQGLYACTRYAAAPATAGATPALTPGEQPTAEVLR